MKNGHNLTFNDFLGTKFDFLFTIFKINLSNFILPYLSLNESQFSAFVQTSAQNQNFNIKNWLEFKSHSLFTCKKKNSHALFFTPLSKNEFSTKDLN